MALELARNNFIPNLLNKYDILNSLEIPITLYILIWVGSRLSECVGEDYSPKLNGLLKNKRGHQWVILNLDQLKT